MIVVTVFHSILNQMEFHLVQNRKENCHPRSYPIQCERKLKYSFLSVPSDAGAPVWNTLQDALESPQLNFHKFEKSFYLPGIQDLLLFCATLITL